MSKFRQYEFEFNGKHKLTGEEKVFKKIAGSRIAACEALKSEYKKWDIYY